MGSTYATIPDLTARLSSAYTVPADAATLLTKASELIDFMCFGRAEEAWTGIDTVLQGELTKATCDQVEYWLETGEEHDVLNLHGALIGGRVQVQNLPGILGPRAKRVLLAAGLYWPGAGAL